MNPWPVKRWILKILAAGFVTAVIWSSTAWILGVMFLATDASFTWWQFGRDQERARKQEGLIGVRDRRRRADD